MNNSSVKQAEGDKMFCQQIVEAEVIGQDERVVRSIITTLREGSELISHKMMTEEDILDTAIGQVKDIIVLKLRLCLSEVLVLGKTKGKSCSDLASEIEKARF